MTPYAVLMVKPTDPDEVIRKAYHIFARATHEDFHKHKREEWERYTGAYTAIKTAEKREEWERRQSLLADRCTTCEGVGVRGTRMFKGKLRLCEDCKGEGRTR